MSLSELVRLVRCRTGCTFVVLLMLYIDDIDIDDMDIHDTHRCMYSINCNKAVSKNLLTLDTHTGTMHICNQFQRATLCI